MDDMRKAFEAWVDEAHGLWIAPNDDGTYADSRTQYMWNAWQAATLAERGRASDANADLVRRIEALEKWQADHCRNSQVAGMQLKHFGY